MSQAIWDRIFLINQSGHRRTAVVVSKGTLAPISFPRVRMLYGIVRLPLHDYSSASRVRRSPNNTSNTNLVFRGLLWRQSLLIPPAARENLQLPPLDSVRLPANHQIPPIDHRARESSPNPSIDNRPLSRDTRRSP